MPETAVVKTQAEIPYSIIEYTAQFKKPILEAWTMTGVIISAALDALEPYGFKVDGVEIKTNAEKINDYSMTFLRNPPGVTFTLGLSKLVVVAENLDWKEADQFIKAAHAGIDVLMSKSKAEVSTQHLACALHIQLKTRPRHEVTAPLLSPLAMQLLDGELKFPGIILQREKASILVDASVPYANGLFVKFNRDHQGNVALEEIAVSLRKDEERLFETLGLEGEL